jgi:tetratricopeptide (TPR) repeat protein
MLETDPAPRTKREPRRWIVLLAALALVTTAYSNSLDGPFVWDDRLLVTEESLVHELSPLVHLRQAFWRQSATAEADATYYRPVTTISYAIDWARSKGRPGPFHATNLLVHLGVCALVFSLALQAGATSITAGASAALFGLLPRLTESVTWISGRTDPLATLFTLGAVGLYLGPRSNAVRRSAAAVLLLLGLLSKEVALAGLVGIAAAEGAKALRGDLWRDVLRRFAPLAVAAAIYAALRVHGLHGVPSARQIPIDAAALMPVQAFGRYALMLLDPLRPRLQIGLLGTLERWTVAVGVLVLIAVALGFRALVRRRATPLVVAMCAAALTAILLVSHIIRIRLNVLAADRFLYLPAATLSVALAAWASQLGGRPLWTAAACAGLALPALAIGSYRRNLDWSDEVRLWRVAVETTPPTNPLPEHELADALAYAGRDDEAILHYEAVLAKAPPYLRPAILANIATSLSEAGRLESAEERLRQVIAIEPRRPVHHFNLAIVEAKLLRFDDAERELATALQQFPGYSQALRFQAVVTAARQELAALPPETASESTAVRRRRAALWVWLNVPSKAIPLLERVSAAPDASRDALVEAASYLAKHATHGSAIKAIERARAAGVPAQVLDAIRTVLEERFAGDQEAL